MHVRRGTNAGWTLLEFGQAASRKSKVPQASIPVRSVPPEVSFSLLLSLSVYNGMPISAQALGHLHTCQGGST